MYQQYELNRVYKQTIVSITEGRRNFTKPGQPLTFYVHDIYARDDKGDYKAEYVTITPTQDAFKVGEEVCLKCTVKGRVSDEIEACEDSEKGRKPTELNRNQTITGTTYSCAIICAKDIAAARIANSLGEPDIDKVTEEMFLLAEEINLWLIAKREGQ